MKERSQVTKIEYDTDECVMITNALQTYKYIDNGAQLLDIFCGNENRLIFVFNKKDTYELYDKWCKHLL